MSTQSPASKALSSLLGILDLEPLELNLFRGRSPADGWQRVFGGQVLGQALMAASRTVPDDRTTHSLHAYFLLAGDPAHPIIYEVEHTRDGGSFTTRRVKAVQHGRIIFTMAASFQKPEDSYEHQAKMPEVPPPESLPNAHEVMARYIDLLPANMKSYWNGERPIEMKPVDLTRYLTRQPTEPIQHIWVRASAPLPDNPRLHEGVLAYASDFTLLDTALIAHGKLLFDPDIQLASLDHALWIHRPFRIDDWLLYVQDSPNANGARGLCRGSFFTRDGVLIASTAQEGLIRKRNTAFLVK